MGGSLAEARSAGELRLGGAAQDRPRRRTSADRADFDGDGYGFTLCECVPAQPGPAARWPRSRATCAIEQAGCSTATPSAAVQQLQAGTCVDELIDRSYPESVSPSRQRSRRPPAWLEPLTAPTPAQPSFTRCGIVEQSCSDGATRAAAHDHDRQPRHGPLPGPPRGPVASPPPAPPRRSAPADTTPVGVGAARILVGGGAADRGRAGAAQPRPHAWARGPSRSPPRAWRSTSSRSSRRSPTPGVAVGTIVALGSRAHARRPVRVDRRAAAGPTSRWAVATALACAGVALLALAGGAADVSAPGVALAVTAGGAYAVYTLAAKRLARRRARARVRHGGGVRDRRARAAPRAARHPTDLAAARRRDRARAVPRDRADRARVPAVRQRARVA